MIAPIGAPTFSEALRQGAEVYHALKSVLKAKGWRPAWATRAGSRPVSTPTARRSTSLVEAIGRAGFRPGAEHRARARRAATEFFSDGRTSSRASPRRPRR